MNFYTKDQIIIMSNYKTYVEEINSLKEQTCYPDDWHRHDSLRWTPFIGHLRFHLYCPINGVHLIDQPELKSKFNLVIYLYITTNNSNTVNIAIIAAGSNSKLLITIDNGIIIEPAISISDSSCHL